MRGQLGAEQVALVISDVQQEFLLTLSVLRPKQSLRPPLNARLVVVFVRL